MRQFKSKKRAKGTAQIRKEKRNGAERWGYDVWIRQPDGTRKRYRDFTFATKAEATQALAILRTTGWKARYGLKEPTKARHTTIKEAMSTANNVSPQPEPMVFPHRDSAALVKTLRVEIQTKDPKIKIIWFVQQETKPVIPSSKGT